MRTRLEHPSLNANYTVCRCIFLEIHRIAFIRTLGVVVLATGLRCILIVRIVHPRAFIRPLLFLSISSLAYSAVVEDNEPPGRRGGRHLRSEGC
jgi:hypothetical protein